MQKSSVGASLQGEMAYLDCLITKHRPEVRLERAGRFIHHLQEEHRFIHHVQWEYQRLLKGVGVIVKQALFERMYK